MMRTALLFVAGFGQELAQHCFSLGLGQAMQVVYPPRTGRAWLAQRGGGGVAQVFEHIARTQRRSAEGLET